jgi:PRTRC genetic system protein C
LAHSSKRRRNNMAATIKAAPRVFKYGATEIPDPLPNSTPERCLEVLRTQYPQFTNAAVDGPFHEGGKQVWQIKVAAGTKG